VELSLRVHGLPVERAGFRGVPERLVVTAGGQAMAPAELDEHRDGALVAILTDGRVLSSRYAVDSQRSRIDVLLRLLSRWPHIAVVDFSAGANDLRRILARHGLEAVTPEDLAGFLGAETGGAARAEAEERPGEDGAWAAVCALSPAPLDEATAFELRRRLGLATSSWAIRALRAEAPGPPGKLWWEGPARARRLNWLRDAEGTHAGGLLDQALDFWEERYAREERAREEAEPAVPWCGTPAQQHLAVERALLRLWRRAGEAIRDLYKLHRGALREVIRQQLGALAPAGRGGAEVTQLPWSWGGRSAVERAMLQEMGFGGGMPQARLRRPGRLWLGIGLCLGLGLGALLMAAGKRPQPAGMPHIRGGAEWPEGAHVALTLTDRDWIVSVGTDRAKSKLNVSAGALVDVQWKQESRPCVEDLGEGLEAWHCGRRGLARSLLPDGIQWSTVHLRVPRQTPASERVALEFLDSGSADVVTLGSRLEVDLSFTPDNSHQVLVLTSSSGATRFDDALIMLEGTLEIYDRMNALRRQAGAVELKYFRTELLKSVWLEVKSWDALALALQFKGLRRASSVVPDAKVNLGDPETIWLRGSGSPEQ
jgi:hypothetical protein